MSTSTSQAYVGRRRVRKTSRRVLIADRVATWLITLGGMGTIIAVSLVCVFLIWVVIPLFLPASAEFVAAHPVTAAASAGTPVHLSIDEHLTIAWAYYPDGTLTSYRLEDGTVLGSRQAFAGPPPRCWSFPQQDGEVAFGFADGTVQLGRITVDSQFVPLEELPSELANLGAGEKAAFGDGIVERTPEGQFRRQTVVCELQPPLTLDANHPVELIDQSTSSRGTVLAALSGNGMLRLARVTTTKNLLTGRETTKLQQGELDLQLPSGAPLPKFLRLAGLGDAVVVAWEDGRTLRIDTRDAKRPAIAEELDVVIDPEARLTQLGYLIGKTSLLVGDSSGRVRVWFRTRPDDATTRDGSVLMIGHDLRPGDGAVTSLASSSRSRMVVVGHASGQIQLFHVTSSQELIRTEMPNGSAAVEAVALGPKDDAVVAFGGRQLSVWRLDAPHPETTWSSIFLPVWYEGYNEPQQVWQSSSGEDAFEPKYGLVPLVFGSIKATFYSMLFGAPLALLAAIYNSEFLHPRYKSRIKPTIEIMASLPSVVLGFLAALFFAPLVENIVPQVLTCLVTVPFALLFGAHLWQLLPPQTSVRLRRYRLGCAFVALVAGLWLAVPVGRWIEAWLWAGDVRTWLDGQIGSGAGGWMILVLPLSALIVSLASTRILNPRMREVSRRVGRTAFAALDLVQFLVNCLLAVGLAYGVAVLLDGLGWDPRGVFFGTYIQRNAMVVGFIMGFAIIPIIFTIADDALSAVPESLRAGSLATGATPWQTAVRVVIPTAMSGLFSALMIGLGRAVGETMIVLMAAGNTPVMDLNIFNGFRTLSANIAVELPEAVRNSTHYRMLFLAALSLFVLTFLVNTVAEVVRVRFRRRAFQL